MVKCCTLFEIVEEDTKDKGKLYKPTSRFEKDVPLKIESTESSNHDIDYRPDKPGKKKIQDKKKSNLEIFKEELKM